MSRLLGGAAVSSCSAVLRPCPLPQHPLGMRPVVARSVQSSPRRALCRLRLRMRRSQRRQPTWQTRMCKQSRRASRRPQLRRSGDRCAASWLDIAKPTNVLCVLHVPCGAVSVCRTALCSPCMQRARLPSSCPLEELCCPAHCAPTLRCGRGRPSYASPRSRASCVTSCSNVFR